jgi:hypothetical protein
MRKTNARGSVTRPPPDARRGVLLVKFTRALSALTAACSLIAQPKILPWSLAASEPASLRGGSDFFARRQVLTAR